MGTTEETAKIFSAPAIDAKENSTVKYWLGGTGDDQSKRVDFYKLCIIGIGWGRLGDLKNFKDSEEIRVDLCDKYKEYAKKFKGRSPQSSEQKINAKALWQFAHEMKPGDIVVAKKGLTEILGYGIVESDYYYDTTHDEEYANIHKVKWLHWGSWKLDQKFAMKTLTEITANDVLVKKICALFDITYKPVKEKEIMDDRIPKYAKALLSSKNIIFHGAPGTGKTFLAHKIAADIISEGACDEVDKLTAEQKQQMDFVQFHPSYDYADFVEGLRPRINDDGSMSFELRDGIFKQFVARARKNFEDSQKSEEVIERELSVEEALAAFFDEIDFGETEFETLNHNKFTVNAVDGARIYISIPGNAVVNKLILKLDELRQMLNSDVNFSKVIDLQLFFKSRFGHQEYSYDLALYKEIIKRKNTTTVNVKKEEPKNFVFIIDEINRGEISKIFGELFFAVDPGYRGRKGEIATQYDNLHPDEKFYIPENVYIIGTMNDIDRSVDSFDFAMRRRFRFIELSAAESMKMLDQLGDNKKDGAKARMKALNEAIAKTEDLNENYQIGAAYFLKLKDKDIGFEQLWSDYLEPLLQEYVRGLPDEKELMKKFKEAYDKPNVTEGNADDSAQDQG